MSNREILGTWSRQRQCWIAHKLITLARQRARFS